MPLKQDGVVNSSICEDLVVWVPGVHTFSLALACVSVTLTIARDLCLIDPVGVG